MSKKKKNREENVVKVNEKITWDNVREVYENAVKTYSLVVAGLMKIANKYKEEIDKVPNLRKILDGASKTLLDQKVLINGVALTHIEVCDKEDKNCFKIPNSPEVSEVLGIDFNPEVKELLVRFKTGPVNENDQEEVSKALNAILSYTAIMGNLYTILKNAIDVLVTELEKYMRSLPEDEAAKLEEKLKAEKEDAEVYDNLQKETEKAAVQIAKGE